MTGGVESLGRIRLQGLLLLAAAFVAGGAVGVAGGRYWEGQRAAERRPLPPPPGPRGGRPGQLPPLFERLGLTPDQRARIDAINVRMRPRTDSAVRHLRAITDSVQAEISAVLTPEQRERFEQEQRRFGGRRGGFGGPRGMGGMGGMGPQGGRGRRGGGGPP